MFQILVNGAPVGQQVVIPASQSENRTFVVVHSQGAAAAGRMVTIETSAPTYIGSLSGNLDTNGRFSVVVGPSFGMRGSVTLSFAVGQARKSVEVKYT